MSLQDDLKNMDGMSIVKGNEDAWVDMMLNDPDMLTEMGLPQNLSAEMKAQVKQMILRDMEVFEQNMPQYQNIEETFDENRSPAEQFIEQALVDLGIEYTIEYETPILSRDLEVGKKYKIHFPNGKDAIVILKRIMKNSFGDDYIFKNISGAENLVGKSSILGTDEFPLPEQLISQTKFSLLS